MPVLLLITVFRLAKRSDTWQEVSFSGAALLHCHKVNCLALIGSDNDIEDEKLIKIKFDAW